MLKFVIFSDEISLAIDLDQNDRMEMQTFHRYIPRPWLRNSYL